MAQDWTRIEGMIIGHELDPSVVAGELPLPLPRVMAARAAITERPTVNRLTAGDERRVGLGTGGQRELKAPTWVDGEGRK